MTARPTIYVIDDDLSTTNAIESMARTMNLACKVFTSGLEFLDTFDPGQPACLIAEVRIADISGLQIQRRLAGRGVAMPVIFLTAHATVSVVVRAMSEGAVTVLEKPLAEQELWDSVQHALRLDKYHRQRAGQRTELKAKILTLNENETEVLEMVFQGKHNKQIAEAQAVSVRTVEARRSRLMKKLEVGSLVELIQVALACRNGCPGQVCDHPFQCLARGGDEPCADNGRLRQDAPDWLRAS